MRPPPRGERPAIRIEPDTGSNPYKFQRLVEDDLARLAPVISSIGIKRD